MPQAVALRNQQNQVANQVLSYFLNNPGAAYSRIRSLFPSTGSRPSRRGRLSIAQQRRYGVTRTRARSSGGNVSKSVSSSRVYARGKGRKRQKKHKSKLLSIIHREQAKTLGKLFSYRDCRSTQRTSNANECSYGALDFGVHSTLDTIASTYGKQLSSTGTIETIDYSDTDGHSLKLKGNCSAKIIVRNNSAFGAELRMYAVVPRQDTSVSISSTITSGLDDFSLSDGGLETDICYYPSDSKLFMSTYKIVKRVKVVLEPGASIEFHANRDLYWSQDYKASHNLSYPKSSYMGILFRVQGVVSHDATTNTQIGVGPTQLDVMYLGKYDVRGVGSYNQMEHTVGTGSLGTLSTTRQYQASDPGKEDAIQG